ncbi:MAG: nucleoside recognition domain-containing protein [Myxococcota bacterium]
MNLVFVALILLGCLYAMGADAACALGLLAQDAAQCQKGLSAALTNSLFDAATTAAELSLKLIGVMTLWLGLMKVAERAGLIELVGRLVEPVMTRLFPEIPKGHPAISAMTLNLSANALGIGNAATPLGIKAMQELQKLNPVKHVATDAMCLFMAMHATSFTPLPSQTIALRQAAGAADPSDIVGPVALATAITAVLAVVLAKIAKRVARPQPVEEQP